MPSSPEIRTHGTPPGIGHIHLPRESSQAIRVARVVCILSMVSVHFWPGATQILRAPVSEPLHAFYLIVIDYLGRGSVPLLSVISGVLLAQSFAKTGGGWRLILSKARSLLVPMVLWSVILLALYLAHAWISDNRSNLPVTPMQWVNALFSLTAPPVNEPLGFLRDVFLAAVLGVLALTLCRRSMLAGIGVFFALTVLEVMTGGCLFLRPQILVFFGLGLLLAVCGQTGFLPPWWLVLLAVGLEATLRHIAGLEMGNKGAGLALFYLARLAMSLLMWRVALDVSRSDNMLHRLTRAIEPYIFIIFCSHMIAVAGVALLAHGAGLSVTSPVYPLVFLLQFVLVTLFGMAITILGKRYAPGLLAILSGKQVPAGASFSSAEPRLKPRPE